MEDADGSVYIVIRVLSKGWRLTVDKVNFFAYNPSGGEEVESEGEALPVYEKCDPPAYIPLYGEAENV
jgi:hypothetical protein